MYAAQNILSKIAVLADKIVPLGGIVAEIAPINLVCVMTDAVRQSSHIDLSVEIISLIVHAAKELIDHAHVPMDLLTTSNIPGVRQTSHLSVLVLHGENFSKARLAISHTILQLAVGLQLLGIGLSEAFIFQAVALALEHITHISVLAKRPVC